MLRHVRAPDGVALACEVAGDGPPLVMVHGAGSARWSFDLVRRHLEPHFSVWALDRRGRGDSDDGQGYSIEQEFEDVAAVVRAAGSDDTTLFGHSYGGLVCAGAAIRLDRLQRLVLYEPPMGGVLADEAWIQRFEDRIAGGERAAAVREFLRDIGGYNHEEIDAMEGTAAWETRLQVAPTVPRELRAEQVLSLDALGLRSLAAVPCVLLVGSESPDWARRSTDVFAAAMRGAEVRTLRGHGHGAAVSGPELLATELERLLPHVIESRRDGDAPA